MWPTNTKSISNPFNKFILNIYFLLFRHFSDELLAIVNEYPDPCACLDCEYKGDKPKTLSIHVGLVHAKLDLFLQNQSLVQSKRQYFHAKPKKLSIGPVCPVCDVKFTKTQNRDHVSWHYIDELRAIGEYFFPTLHFFWKFISNIMGSFLKSNLG